MNNATTTPEISVVMPCLDEEQNVGECVERAWEGLARTGRAGEVIVADNGSRDGSVVIAQAARATVVHQPQRGYGNAYLAGFGAARGRIVVMGDADGTYDFRRLDELVTKLDEGYDYVLGSRFAGTIERGAMPWLHRYVGNPVLTGVLNRFFGLRSSDAHSGMRAFTREALDRMELRCEGMEFASEIVIKAARAGLRVAEVPITYAPRGGESKLKTVRDGWRHLRFMLLLSPRWLFLVPGLVMFVVGMLGQSLLVPGRLDVGPFSLDIHVNVACALLALLGAQSTVFGAFCHALAVHLGLERRSRLSTWVLEELTVERGLAASVLVAMFGFMIDFGIVVAWIDGGMRDLDAVREALFALTMLVLGAMGVFSTFFLSFLRMTVHAPTRRERLPLAVAPA